jgi:hypothetical protein
MYPSIYILLWFSRVGSLRLLDGLDEGGEVGNTAGVLSHLELDEAVLSPVGVPGVPDDPVRGVCVGVVPDKLNGVVHLPGGGVATGGVHDTAGVTGPLGSVDSDGHGAVLLEGRGDGISVLGTGAESLAGSLGVSPVGDRSSCDSGKVGLAGSGDSLSGGVGVVRVGGESTAGLDVLEGVGGEASVAAVVGLVATHKLLGGKLGEGVSGNSPGGLDGLGGGEGPARSALLLVLDGGELALIVPVEGSRGGGELVLLRELNDGELGGTDVGVNSKEELELILGVVGELGDAVDLILSSSGKGSVGLSDLLNGLLEESKAVSLLLGGALNSVLGEVGIVPLLGGAGGGEKWGGRRS